MWVRSLGWEDPLEEGMAAHSSILAWKTPWTEEPGGMQSMGPQRVRHDWSDLACFMFQYSVILILLQRFLLYEHLFLVPYCCKSCHEDLVLESTFSSVSSVASDSWDLMDCSTPSIPVHHQLLDFAQTHVPSSWWCHPTFSSSIIPFFSCLQSFPASRSFPVTQFFASGGQNIGVFSFSISPSKEY